MTIKFPASTKIYSIHISTSQVSNSLVCLFHCVDLVQEKLKRTGLSWQWEAGENEKKCVVCFVWRAWLENL